MPLLQCEQRSPEWHAARLGKLTASLAAAALGLDPHKGPLAAYREIVEAKAQADNKHMSWGREFEGTARAAYEVESGNLVTETGLWIHDSIPWLAASPDGLCGDDGLVEIKCPSLIPEAIPRHHQIQMLVQMACARRAWCDYFAWSQAGHFLSRFDRSESAERDILKRLTDWHAAHILTGIPPARRRKTAITSDGEIR